MPQDHRFSFERFAMEMLRARKAGLPILPPARPLFLNPEPLALLGRLAYHHGDDTFQRLEREMQAGRAAGN